VLEVQREAAIAAAAGLDPTAVVDDDDVPVTEPGADAVTPAPTAPPQPRTPSAPVTAASAAAPTASSTDEAAADEEPEGEASIPPAPPAPHTQSIPIQLGPIDVEELGLADRLGLGRDDADGDDEVGPTS
jgi:cell division transport system ATP-binding protein